MSKRKLTLKDVPQKVKDIAAFISAVLVIFTSLIGAGHWIVKEVTASTNDRIDALEDKIDDNQRGDELATTRLELMVLMEQDPDNIVEIEKLARHYFLDLKGNSYLTSIFSRYCTEHNLNCAEIVIK